MAPTDDQKALLRLLAQREEGYEDIAALMGLSVEEVRARVRGALAALDEQRAAAPAAEPPPPKAPAPAAAPAEEPEAVAPTPIPPAPAKSTSPSKRPSLPRIKLPSDRRRLAEIVGGVVVAIAVVLFAVGVIDLGGGDDSGDSASGGAAPARSAAAASGDEQRPTRAVLRGVGDTPGAKGIAVFGRNGKEVLLLFGAEGLEKTPRSGSYAISLVKSPDNRIPVAAAQVEKDGQAAGQYPVASNVLGLLANGYDQMEVTLVDNADLQSALKQAQKQETTPSYGGQPALRGRVTGPIVEFEGDEEAEAE